MATAANVCSGTFRTWVAKLMMSAYGGKADLTVVIPSVPTMCIYAAVFIECGGGRLAGDDWLVE